jgi:hypothetical protein
MSVLSGCGAPRLGPGFAPDAELYDVTALAIAAWNEHGADLYLDGDGTPVRLIDGECVETNVPGCHLGVASRSRGVIDIASAADEWQRQRSVLHELCHALHGDGDHPDAPGVCGLYMWDGDEHVITPEDVAWAGLAD